VLPAKRKTKIKKGGKSVETTSDTVKNSSCLCYYAPNFGFGSINQNFGAGKYGII